MSRRVYSPPRVQASTIDKFSPAYWYVNFPIPAMATVVTTGSDSLRVKGKYYTNADTVQLIWESVDSKDHPLFAYETSRNYHDLTFSFDMAVSGLRDFDAPFGATLTAVDDRGNHYFVRLENYRTAGTVTDGHFELDFDQVKAGNDATIDVPWGRIERLFFSFVPADFGAGLSTLASDLSDGATTADVNVTNGVDLKPGDVIDFEGAASTGHIITSTTSGPQQTVTFDPAVEVTGGAPIPAGADVTVEVAESSPITEVDAQVDITNMSVAGGNTTLAINDAGLEAHELRMTDGFDNAYPFPPERILRNMEKLGYRDWYVLYMGISKFHSLTYDSGEDRYIVDLSDPVLNPPAEQFLDDLFARLDAAGYNVVISLSYEILKQFMPADWAQRDHDGAMAETGWQPPSSLVAPTNTEAIDYLVSVYTDLLGRIDSLGGSLYFQIGEPWWWDGSFSGQRRPFIYDDTTTALYQSETGQPVPTPFLDDVEADITGHEDYLDWLGGKLGESTLYIRDQVQAAYPSAQSALLFFTPQVLRTTAPMLKRINLPISDWQAPAFDILQMEDYDEVLAGNFDFIRDQTFRVATDILGYDLADVHYFAGFNLLPETSWVWFNIDEALYAAKDIGPAETFVWSREQVLRDGWVYDQGLFKFFPSCTTLAMCWRIERRDGTVKRFTTHDKPVTFDAETYSPIDAYAPSDVESNSDLSADDIEVTGIISDEITDEDLMKGLYDDAAVEVFVVDWQDPSLPKTPLRQGWIGEVTSDGRKYQANLRGFQTKLNQEIGDVYSPECRADLGDASCKIDLQPLTVTGTVTGVPGQEFGNLGANDRFVDSSRTESDGWFTYGLVTWTSGANTGATMDVIDYGYGGGEFTLFEPMPYPIQAGDTYEVYPGCDKRLETCIDKFDNVINFRGEPFVPGTDAVLNTPNAKSG